MGHYAASADVAKRLPTRTLNGGSTPSSTTVDGWIDELEAEVDGLLDAAGAGVPISAARGVSILKAKVISGATARWKSSVATGTTFEDGRTADQDWQEWEDWKKKIETEPATVLKMLSGSTGSSSQLRSYFTDNTDGLDPDAGDFDPPIGISKSRDPD